jgi:hypothetical protein
VAPSGTEFGSTGLMPAVTPLHPGPARFAGGLTEVGPGIHAWLQPNGLLGESNAGLVIGDGGALLIDTLWDPRLTRHSPAATARELVLGDEIAERGFANWLAPERALVSVATIDAHRRGVAKPPGPRQLIAAFFRMALLARDLEARASRENAAEVQSTETEGT